MANAENEASKNLLRGSLTVRVGVIRDGTQGISLSMGKNLIAEWTNSKARTLSLTEDYKVAICAISPLVFQTDIKGLVKQCILYGECSPSTQIREEGEILPPKSKRLL